MRSKVGNSINTSPITPEQEAWAKRLKEWEVGLLEIIHDARALDWVDQRAAALGKTQIETGFMWLQKSVTQPEKTS